MPKLIETCKRICAILIMAMTWGMLHSCMATLPGKGPYASKTYKAYIPMRVALKKRSYHIHIPPQFNQRDSMALVIVLHGAFSNAGQIEEQTGFSRLADRKGFLVVYPNGAYGIFGYLQHWNAGHCCGRAADKQIVDVAFLDAVIDSVCNRFPVDLNRIYLTGFSNGGMLVHYYAALRSERLAAIAPLAATIGSRADSTKPWNMIPEAGNPLPVISFHARDDDSIPFDGGSGTRHKNGPQFVPVLPSMAYWKKLNGCNPVVVKDTLNQCMLLRMSWPHPQHQYPVVLYVPEKWGHRWPGTFFSDTLPEEHPLHGMDATQIIWDFFKQFSK